MIVVHARKKSGVRRRVGTLVATKSNDNVVRIGYSKCKVAMDMFDSEHGISMALGRASGMVERGRRNIGKEHNEEQPLPQSLELDMKKFVVRAMRYYKTKEIQVYGLPQQVITNYIKEWENQPEVAAG